MTPARVLAVVFLFAVMIPLRIAVYGAIDMMSPEMIDMGLIIAGAFILWGFWYERRYGKNSTD